MSTVMPDSDGPSDHAVGLARAWLSVAGWIWLVVGIVIALGSSVWSAWVPIAIIAFAIAHFVLARFASRRLAVFFAVFGP